VVEGTNSLYTQVYSSSIQKQVQSGPDVPSLIMQCSARQRMSFGDLQETTKWKVSKKTEEHETVAFKAAL
jgi:hypothetical protein